MTSCHPIGHRAAVAAETATFTAVLNGADLATPVPTCPGWTLADLVKHTGSVQRWFASLLNAHIQSPPQNHEAELRLPARTDAYPGWLVESAAVAADAFTATEPNLPMWAWGADQHVRFWARRMLFETLVHRADAELALGLRPAIDRALAVDGIDEFLVNLPFAAFFAPKVANLRGTGETIRFHTTDKNADWLVSLSPDGFGIEQAGAPADTTADATVRATAADLLLLLYGRRHHTTGAVEHEGDQDLLLHWFANSAF
ncbi:maleylpyruvate isomerase family mycothiol-dependent enzyme [Streptomyces halobius]|uniref:Maleylpyruvate isomerase family mycothiol-dependent enzyme n=1 Tax=Streptomyces halobius TaxID=2879846 RepID=A0ABY4MHN4_9ACTN|nr:maleylpyruvate isomerase family mycothiol-dependent enzyme [Streptomyces halobius]UQA96862.1 maleylpyruvate isomerase family mycothiol-dependent enzyme [Streptomyces halobius]